MDQKRVPHCGSRVPWATILLLVLLLGANYALLLKRPGLNYARAYLSNQYQRTIDGEIWRPFLSWLPHADRDHLYWDIGYLAVAGFIFERSYGGRRLLLLYFVLSSVGSWLSTFFDWRFSEVLGSSAGAHGLVAYFCVRDALATDVGFLMRSLYGMLLAYLLYLTVWGLMRGHMGWPFGFFPNGGYDHLGGVGLAAVIVGIEQVIYRLYYRMDEIEARAAEGVAD